MQINSNLSKVVSHSQRFDHYLHILAVSHTVLNEVKKKTASVRVAHFHIRLILVYTFFK